MRDVLHEKDGEIMLYEMDFMPVDDGESSGGAICLRYPIDQGQNRGRLNMSLQKGEWFLPKTASLIKPCGC